MRIAVLPRDAASAIITTAVTRAAWAVSLANLALAAVLLTDFLATRGLLAALPGPLAVILALIALGALAARVDRAWATVLFLVAGTAGNLAYQLALLESVPGIVDDGVIVLNRVAVSLVLAGVARGSAITAIGWSAGGFVLATVSGLAAAALAGAPFDAGWGPAIFLALLAFCHATLALVQAAQRRRVPDFASLEQEMQQLTEEERLRLRTNAAVHDTLLNDLTVVMNAPDELDEHTASRLLDDLHRLDHGIAHTDRVDAGDVLLRNRLLAIISDLQWRGLTVHLTGQRSGATRFAPEAVDAILDAVRAALENVLRHSGQTEAELEFTVDEHESTVIVSDHGHGFDPDAVPADRLGVRDSVVGRIHGVGGSVRVWSTPGGGTSVVMRVPFTAGARQ